MSCNQISKTVYNHYTTIVKILQTYQEDGRTSQPLNHISYLEVIRDDDKKDIEILDLVALEQNRSNEIVPSEEEIFGSLLTSDKKVRTHGNFAAKKFKAQYRR